MVAAVCTWHEHHAEALADIDRRFNRGERLAVAAQALVETYAVLTRLPAPHRLAPADAWRLVKTNFVDQARIVALDGRAYTALLERLASRGMGGGRSYDELIATCAAVAKVETLLTLNPRHFEPAPAGVTAVEPLGASRRD